MAEELNYNDLYHIINRSIVMCGNCKDMPVNKEVVIFKERFLFFMEKAPQSKISEPHLNLKDINQAVRFCDMLEDYRLSIDVYAENEPLEEETYRCLYKNMQYYKPYIYPENQTILSIFENNIKRHLPEFKEQILINEYNKWAEYIILLKKNYNKQRRKNKQTPKNYENETYRFFKDILNNAELKQIKGNSEKLKLYFNCLQIVDCLPSDKYNRKAKFKLKRDLNYSIKQTALLLNEYEIAKHAEAEKNRYHNAMLRATQFASGIARKAPLSQAELNKRAQEEWLYR